MTKSGFYIMPCYNFRPVDNTYTTPMAATIPRLEELLPQLLEFVRTLARQIEAGEIQDGDALGATVERFNSHARAGSDPDFHRGR